MGGLVSTTTGGGISELREQIRARQEAAEQRSAMRIYKRQVSHRDRELAEVAKAGEAEGRQAERSRQQARTAKKRRAPAKRRSSSRRTVRRAAAREVVVPLRRDAVSAVRTFMLTLVVVGIYLFLDNASAVGGFLGGVSRGLEWLRSPDRAIPAKE
jgi:hypothetical protein